MPTLQKMVIAVSPPLLDYDISHEHQLAPLGKQSLPLHSKSQHDIL